MLSTAILKQRAREIGFDLVGIAPVAGLPDLEFARQWAEKGFAGRMDYLRNPKRLDPRRVMPSTKSAVCVGIIYNTPLPYSTEAGKQESGVRIQKSAERKTVACRPLMVINRSTETTTDDWQPTTDDGPPSPGAWVSRYAWGQDYHEVMRAKLEQLREAIEELAPEVETRVYVDTGPLVERAFARFSGIGWMGKNTCLINEEKGSWFFLGVVLTSLDLECDSPAPDRCGSCTACLEACPTGALPEPYVMDASRCISYFTIELKGSIPEEFRAKIGANIFGCDICQDVCPWNSGQPSVVSGQLKSDVDGLSETGYCHGEANESSTTKGRRAGRPAVTSDPVFQPMTLDLPGFSPADSTSPPDPAKGGGSRAHDQGQRTKHAFSLVYPPLEALAALSEDDFRRLFAHSPIKRAKYRGWLRNLSVAMGNSGDGRFVPWLERLAQHDDPVLREHAEWALQKLSKTQQVSQKFRL